MSQHRLLRSLPFLSLIAALGAGLICPVSLRAADDAKGDDQPIKALLILGGCCHDYKTQRKLIPEGISKRANVEWTVAYDPDSTTHHLNPVYENKDWAKGFDVVVHDECSADVKDMDVIQNTILKPHMNGLPGVVLHCAMHCYRTEGWNDKNAPPTPWFKFTGLPSTGHGAQKPIEVTYVDQENPITKGLSNWTTINEELYNNYRGGALDTAHALARGKQGKDDTIVAWTNTFNGKTRVFGTTLGHNNATVADDRYLDLVARGLLWSVNKLDEKHLKPAAHVYMPGAEPKADEPAKEKTNKPQKSNKKAAAPAAGPKADANGMVPVDLALGKAVTASSEQFGNSASSAVDGDPQTRWCAESGTVPQWLQIDLGKPQEVIGCRIVWEKENVYWYKLEGSNDGKEWTTLVDESKSKSTEQVREHTFDACCGNSAAGGMYGVRYLKLTVTGTGPGAWASLYEFQAYGKQKIPLAAAAQAAARPKPRAAGQTPAQTLGSIKLPAAPAGFQLSLFAAPPDVAYPTCIAAKPTGELFVGIDPQGSLGHEVGQGKVLLCSDTSGDGKADKIVEFTKVDHPRGMIWDNGKLFVLHPPDLTVYYDDNGDGVADRSEDLITGISIPASVKGRGADHTTNGIRLGIDGWIYIAMGDFGCDATAPKDGTHLKFHGGGIMRIRTDGTGLEPYARYTRNIYDVAISPLMDVFTRDNTNDGGAWNDRLAYDVPTGNYGYPSLFLHFPGEFVDCLADYGGGSPCGSIFLDEPNLPKGLMTVEWGNSVIDRHPLTATGAGYKAGREKFMDLPRGTDIDADGIGELYASSWVNGSFAYSGPNVGYIVRLTPNGAKAAAFPDLKKATDEQLVADIGSASGVMRQNAQREMVARGDKPAFAGGLEKLAQSDSSIEARAAAIFTLGMLEHDKAIDALVRLSAHDDVREFALRALADRKGDAKVPVAPFVKALTDANPRVRLQAAWGLGRLDNPQTAEALVPLVGDRDFLVSHVAINALVAMHATDACLKALDPSTPALVPGAVLALQQMHDGAVVDGMLNKLSSTTDPATRAQILKGLCRLYNREADWDTSWWGTRPDTTGPYFKAVAWEGTDKIRAALMTALSKEEPDGVRALVVELQRNHVDLPGLAQMLAKMAATDPSFRAVVVDSLAEKPTLTPEEIALLRSSATSQKDAPAVRARAVKALGRNATNAAALDAVAEALAPTLASGAVAPEMVTVRDEFLRDTKHAQNVATFAKLAESDDAAKREIGYAVLLNVAKGKLNKADRKAAAAAVIERAWAKPASSASLLRAIGLTRAEGYADRVAAARKDANPEVSQSATYAQQQLDLEKSAGAGAGNKAMIESLPFEKVVADAVKTKGDAKIGAALFVKQGCVACHTTSSTEIPKGPFLGGIAVRYSRPELCESILKPSAKIAQGFETQWFKTNDGEVVEGFVTKESGDQVVLRNATGAEQTIKKTDIARRGKRETSIMPEGLVAKLTPQDLANLLAYLESLKAN